MASDVCDREHRGRALLPYPEAARLLGETAGPLDRPAERIPLPEATGRILAEPVTLDRDEPPVPRSAMDGFALLSADGAAPRRLRGAIYAGTTEVAGLGPGEAVAVMTGGTVPPGADAVVPVELTSLDPDSGELRVQEAPRAGQHVRVAGEMGARGRVILPAGHRLQPPDLVAAAGCGADPLVVHAAPRVAILSTGDEVIDWRRSPAPHQVRDSNRFGCGQQLAAAGARVVASERVADEPETLRAALRRGLRSSDVVVTIGGVSMGEKDYLPGLFAEEGVACLFHGVAVQPGKPIWVGRRDGAWVLGLPGNPISSFVMTELFGVPLVLCLAGTAVDLPRRLESGRSGGEARARRRERFLPARLGLEEGETRVTAIPEKGSGDWTSLAGANALLHLTAGSSVQPGDPAQFLRLA